MAHKGGGFFLRPGLTLGGEGAVKRGGRGWGEASEAGGDFECEQLERWKYLFWQQTSLKQKQLREI